MQNPIRTRLAAAPTLTLAIALAMAATAATAKPGNGYGRGDGSDSGGSSTSLLSFAADRSDVSVGESVRLSWASTNTRHCFATGDWEGKLPTEGTYTTPALDGPKSYTLECKDGGNGVLRTVAVNVVGPEPAPEPAPEPTPEPVPAPTVDLSAAAAQIASGGTVQLSWSSSNATSCSASGGWGGDKATSGSQSVGPVSTAATYAITCSGAGGSASDSVAVSIASQPTVKLSAASSVVNRGGSAQLSWSSSHASSCAASGGWSGSKATSGNQTVGPINGSTTFSLNCSGTGGSAVTMISVAINDTVTLNWQAPTENVDGTPLNDLAGYRIYYGTQSGSYSDVLNVTSSAASSQAINLTSGDYYFAMTALDADGNESSYSNEVARTVN